jgi:ABC-type polysaccharide/polyol phosphate transport system ATPase subunit
VSGSPAISLENVSKRYTLYHRRVSGLKERVLGVFTGAREEREELWALRGVSIEVGRGTTLAVIGANGCGKSTLLQIIAGILVPDGGQRAVAGRVTSLLELGAGFSPDLSGRENVFLNASLHGLSRHEVAPRFDAIVQFAELERFIDMPVRNYSSGMYMRLGMAVAVHLDPEIVLVDEAFAVGDEAFQRKCLRKLKEFQDRGITIVVVTHDLLLAERIASRACLLEHGALVASGAPADVIAEYHRRASATGGVAGEYRWGSREITIERVDTRHADGSSSGVFRTGEPLLIAMRVHAPQPVSRPVFGLAIYREDGAHITGPNTRMNGFPIETVSGARDVEYRVASLPLLPGRYVLSVSAYDDDLVHPYDHRERVATFTVVEGGTLERFGLVTFDGSWAMSHVAASANSS